MRDQQDDTRKSGAIVILTVVLLLLAGFAYMGYRATVTNVAEKLYGRILASPPARPENYPTEAARFDRCEKILATWHLLENPVIDLEAGGVDLPLPLRITRTTSIANPEDLRKRAGEIFARDLAALSGHQVPSARLSAWEHEIEVWRRAIGR